MNAVTENSAPPLRQMLRVSLPGRGPIQHEYGVDYQQLAPTVRTIEASDLQYARIAPVASRATTWWMPSTYFGAPVEASIDAFTRALAALPYDDARIIQPTGRMAPNEVRVSRTDSPISGTRTWSFDLNNSPAAVRDAVIAAMALLNQPVAFLPPKQHVFRGVPSWERVVGADGTYVPPSQPAPGDGDSEPTPPPGSGDDSGSKPPAFARFG